MFALISDAESAIPDAHLVELAPKAPAAAFVEVIAVPIVNGWMLSCLGSAEVGTDPSSTPFR